MAARKSERLLNLLITLLVSRSYVTKERIRSVVEQYRDAGDEAFEKMFERDKEELRSLGIPIEVGYVDRAFEDEPGYRVERSAFVSNIAMRRCIRFNLLNRGEPRITCDSGRSRIRRKSSNEKLCRFERFVSSPCGNLGRNAPPDRSARRL